MESTRGRVAGGGGGSREGLADAVGAGPPGLRASRALAPAAPYTPPTVPPASPPIAALVRRAGAVVPALLLLLASACAARVQSPGDAAAARLEGRAQARRLTCESRSAADLLAFHGLSGTEGEVFDRLPRSDNPDRGFVGDPDGPPGRLPPEGYGVHAEPVAGVLRTFGLDARAERGRTYAWLEEETRAGRPSIAWVTASCDPSSRTSLTDSTGRAFVAVRGEHSMLVVAADGAGVTVLDPYEGRRRRFGREEFEAAWALLGNMAVSARPPPARSATAAATPAPTGAPK